jgi:hypothetical protein
MATLDDLLEKVREIAEREQRPVEAVLTSMLRDYQAAALPAVSDQGEAEIRAFRRKMYDKARDYWRQVGDGEKAALSDEELDAEFWLFDADDIPRLRSEQGNIDLPPDPLEDLIGLFDSGLDDLSTSVRETLKKTTHPQYGWTTRDHSD